MIYSSSSSHILLPFLIFVHPVIISFLRLIAEIDDGLCSHIAVLTKVGLQIPLILEVICCGFPGHYLYVDIPILLLLIKTSMYLT
jgi:hypothetical protein